MQTARWPWLRNGTEPPTSWTWTPGCTSLVDSLDSLGLPSLVGLDKLTLRGHFHFQDGAVLQGTLLMENNTEETKEILPGVYAGA